MRIIHTSDWHLGHTLYGYDRSEEQAEMLAQIEDIVREESPDALVVSGDIYHTGQPSAAVQTLFTEAVMRIHAACPSMVVVMTAGNHDSASRHEVARVLWLTQNVHMVGFLDKGNTGSHLVEIPGKGFIIAVPYISERSLPEGFYQGLLDSVSERNADGLPVVLSAHLTVSGSDFCGHEDVRDYMVGGISSIEIPELGAGYDYVALGHIHHAQTLSGSDGRVRYSGTPVPVSFDETYPHSVSVVEIASHGAAPVIREVEIRNPHPLVNLPTEGYGCWDEVKTLARAFPKNIPAYVRLNVEVDSCLPPDAKAEAVSIFSAGEARFCLINSRRKAGADAGRKTVTVSEFRAMEPVEVARLYAADSGIEFTPEMETLFREVVAMVGEDRRKQ